MSLKRYATLLAAVTPQNPPNATTRAVSTVVSITTIAPSSSSSVAPSSSSSSSSEESQSQSQEHGTSSSSSSFTTYYSSGLGLYHQRGVSGSAGSVGGGGGAAGAGGPQTYANVVNGNVNLLLGGAMLSLVTTILCVVCYCCHRNIKKRTEAAYRQQQHQWLETDPNMEIYSVEQCYETSGLFLGDSTDGLSVMPTLHHEPPPSYDAVVLHEQQLLQQQQQHQQQLEQLQLQQQQILMQRISPPPGYRSSLDISTHHHPHGPVGGCSRGTPDGSVDAMASGSGAIRGGGGGAATAAAAAGCGAAVNKELQLALNAQSCCSLQRAEVESMWNATEMESMWNAGAAAVAARRGNCLEMETVPPPPAVPLALQGRKHGGQQGFGLNTLGRRYLQQSHQHSHYRQGCPLCGKFRYEAEAEDEVSPCALSVESGLNVGSMRSSEVPPEDANENRMLASAELATCPCPCSTNCDNEDGNGNHMIGESQPEDEANGNAKPATQEAINETTTTTITDVNDENDNASVAATSSARNEEELAAASQDLSNINENGFISLDMSKIIDRSGLPTYEGALKLESSGYV
ncbi:uncharacterized protein s-cup isoform X1 [Drosophila pseudoobscura]|uniref:Uncharacterized protein s-cup isoform X1 n=1 Tax=Drosophila pseudoobscura pseudoobscura TaxID=46245 RepID=A0A6I8V6U8_DROPS|nr:uncharacterized protein LOC4805466 isoform X1 [Drosophila pseudoobscura]